AGSPRIVIAFFISSRRRHTRSKRDWSSDVCSSDLIAAALLVARSATTRASLPPSDLATSRAAAMLRWLDRIAGPSVTVRVGPARDRKSGVEGEGEERGASGIGGEQQYGRGRGLRCV